MSDNPQNKTTNLSKLVWKDERSVIQEHVLQRAVTTFIGRDAGNNIILVNPKVSKRHAELHWSENDFLITDQGSSNGTMVNGKVITTPTKLHNGDRIEIGDFVLSYYISDERPEEELKTRPLEELGAGSGQPVSELRTQILPGMKEKTPEVVVKTEVKAAEIAPETSPTAILEKPSESADSAKEMPKKGEEVMEMQVRDIGADHLEDAFSDLLRSISSAQSTGNTLKNKGLAVKTSLETSIDQLQVVSDEMKNLEGEAVKAGLSELVKKLTATPNDVTLLMELSRYTNLLGKILRDYSVQAAIVEKIKTKLESDLKTYIS